jgi:hypothetical protein
VTGGSARHGRRNNGLFAAEYAAVGDVDPRVGEHLLDVLGNRGIAAYLQPSADQHPVTRLTTLPGRPVDRLFVDRRELTTAREFFDIVTADTAGAIDPDGLNGPPAPATRSASEFEAAWASIVASFDAPPAAGPRPWPASEDDNRGGAGGRPMPDPTRAIPDMTWRPPTDPTISTSSDPTAPPAVTGPPVTPSPSQPPPPQPTQPPQPAQTPETPQPPRTGWDGNDHIDAGPSLLDGLDTFGRDLPDDEDQDGDEDYHPPAPPPLPRFAGITVIGMLGIIVGIAVIIYPAMLPVSTGFAEILGGACLVAGGAALIARLRSGDEDDYDDPDNGAVV